MTNLIHSFMSQASAKGSRSTALHSLQWALGILLSAIPICIFVKAPVWILVFITISAGVCIATFIITYIYLLLTNPDALRSETFTLSKMAIEKGLIGDNVTGLQEAEHMEVKHINHKSLSSDQGVIE